MSKSSSSLIAASFLAITFVLTYGPAPFLFTPNARSEAATVSSPPLLGFQWSMRERFGDKDADDLVEYHWNTNTQIYEPGYINPASWTVDFDSCTSVQPQSSLSWEVDGQLIPETRCRFSHVFPTLKTYVVKLTATSPGGPPNTAEASVTLKDLFIVSLGDSFASGEGNPDKPRHGLRKAKWIDERCHRSAFAGPAQAAMNIEKADPHTSVTFISFACSGAELSAGLTSGQQKGSRLLRPQLDKMFEAAARRPIDALLVSIGGNDANFATLVLKAIQLRHAETDTGTNRLANDGLASLPVRFAAIAERLNRPTNQTAIANVFITEYPDLVRDETRDFCDHSPGVPDLLHGISEAESTWALMQVIKPLNAAVKTAATINGWNYVDGIFTRFGGESPDHIAHGFCAGNQRWARTFNDSFIVQGDQKGTVHPNFEGHVWYAQRLVDELRSKGVIAPGN
ncbi:MAG: hypothetical protein QOD75_824 [Blastocatellia bacterium]|nr:hypothetical protein [Blastocatellia bacterium]